MKTTFIYALCEPGTRTVRYIGKADAPEKRLQRHLRYNSIGAETYLGRWLRSLAAIGTSPALVILAEVPRASWQEEEIRYIRAARVLGLRLTNGTDGGDGVTMTPEVLAKISAANSGENHPMFGKTHPPEFGAKISARVKGENHPMFGKHHSLESRAKQSASLSGEKNPAFGKIRTPEHCANLSAANLRRPPNPEANAKSAASRRGKKRGPYKTKKIPKTESQRSAIIASNKTRRVSDKVLAIFAEANLKRKLRAQEIALAVALK